MKYRKGYKYQLAEVEGVKTLIYPTSVIRTQFITLYLNGYLEIESGYAWDGASGPTWDTDNTMTPSLFHDAFYQLLRMGLLEPRWRLEVDMLLHQMLLDRGMWVIRAWYWNKGVGYADGDAALPENIKTVYEVV